MKGWKNRAIRTLGRVVTGKTPSKNIVDFWQGDELFVSPRDMEFDSRYITNTQSRISVKALQKFAGQNIPKNTVMYTALSYGFGKIGIASKQLITNQQINSIIVNEENNFRFVYYLLRINTPYIFSFNSGIDTPIVPKSVFEKIQLSIPTLLIQRKIAAILSAYDDLIENNTRRIAILEKMAEELYREWFVRLRFPGHETVKIVKGVPEGWEINDIGNIINFLSGYSFKSKKYLLSGKFGIATIKNVQDGHYINEYSDFIDEIPSNMKVHCKLNAGDVLMSLTGNVGRVCRVIGDNALLNQRVAKLKLKISNASQFIYYTFRTRSMLHLVENLSLGSTAQMNLSPIQLSKQRLLVPSKDLLEKYEKLVLSIKNSQISYLTGNSLLTSSRDRLLSRLMSGAIDVENLDIEFPKSMQEEAIDA